MKSLATGSGLVVQLLFYIRNGRKKGVRAALLLNPVMKCGGVAGTFIMLTVWRWLSEHPLPLTFSHQNGCNAPKRQKG